MTGIAGIFHQTADQPMDDGLLVVRNNYKGGHERVFQREAILFLHSDRRQVPRTGSFASQDRVTVVMDGEIYNADGLRSGLGNEGVRWETGEDAELLVYLYQSRGVDMVRVLNGAFAFALWDAGTRQLVLGRDRLGERPLFYAAIGETLIFGSELRFVLAHPVVRRNLDLLALDAYFTYQYVPPPMTIFEGIRRLPPAHLLISDDRGSRLQRYWELGFAAKATLSQEEWCGRILDHLERATRLRAVEGGRYAVYLSGGTDSSLVVATLQRVSPGSVEAFTVGAKEETLSDISYARAVADLWKIPHHPLEITPRIIEALPELVWQFGEPFADSSLLPTYFASLAIRQVTGVAFCGDGGDECFGGYLRYLADRKSPYSRYLVIPGVVRRALAAMLATIPDGADLRYHAPLSRAKRFSELIAMSPERRYVELVSNFTRRSKGLLYAGALRAIPPSAASDLYERRYAESDARDLVDRFLALDLVTYLAGDILPKFDIASTATDLVARSPFLDHELVEFAAIIPSDLKIRGTMNKYILKEAATRWIPRDLIYRPKKGFSIPVRMWLRGPWRSLVSELLLGPSAMHGCFLNPAYVRTLLEEHMAGKVDHAMRIWILLNFEIWCRSFLDGRGDRPLSWEEMVGREVRW